MLQLVVLEHVVADYKPTISTLQDKRGERREADYRFVLPPSYNIRDFKFLFVPFDHSFYSKKILCKYKK